MLGLGDSSKECHVAVFQDDPVALVQHMRTFIGTKLERGGAVLLIVEPTLADQYGAWLAKQRKSVQHRCLILDAETTLEQLCSDGRIDPERFEARIGGLIRRAKTAGNGRVAIVGEMAGMLWQQGRQRDAVELEMLWHAAFTQYGIRLLCPYSHASFRNDPAGVCNILHVHSHVDTLPSLTASQEEDIPTPREPHRVMAVVPCRPRRPAPAAVRRGWR